MSSAKAISMRDMTNIDIALSDNTTASQTLAAPLNLVATANGSSQIDLTWTNNSGTAIEVWRSLTSGSGFELIHTTAVDATAYSDTGRDPETTYYYQVRANNGMMTSAYSNEDSATTEAAPSYAFENALDFDGVNDFVSLGSTISFTGDFTWVVYVNHDVSTNQNLLAGSTSGHLLQIRGNSTIRVNFGGSAANKDFIIPSFPWSNGWHQIVITRSGTTGRVHVDGVESPTGPLSVSDGTHELKVIGASHSFSGDWDGKIDELYTWDGVVATGANATTIYDSGNALDPESVLGIATNAWRFNNTSGTILTALRGGVNGNLNNFIDPDSAWIPH